MLRSARRRRIQTEGPKNEQDSVQDKLGWRHSDAEKNRFQKTFAPKIKKKR